MAGNSGNRFDSIGAKEKVLRDLGVFGLKFKVLFVLNSGLGASVTWSGGRGCHTLVESLSQDVSST